MIPHRQDTVSVVLPFHPGLREPDEALGLLRDAVDVLQTLQVSIIVVQDGVDLYAPTAGVQVETLPSNTGKIAAARLGVERALRQRPSCQRFAIADFDDEQEIADVRKMTEHLGRDGVQALVGNRYAYLHETKTPLHRILVNEVQRALTARLDQRLTDLPAAMAACTRQFAELFVSQSRSSREGIGFDWSVLAFLNKTRIADFAIGARMRTDRTNGAKLARNFRIIANYEPELRRAGHSNLVDFAAEYVAAVDGGLDYARLPMRLLHSSARIALQRVGDDYTYVRY